MGRVFSKLCDPCGARDAGTPQHTAPPQQVRTDQTQHIPLQTLSRSSSGRRSPVRATLPAPPPPPPNIVAEAGSSLQQGEDKALAPDVPVMQAYAVPFRHAVVTFGEKFESTRKLLQKAAKEIGEAGGPKVPLFEPIAGAGFNIHSLLLDKCRGQLGFVVESDAFAGSRKRLIADAGKYFEEVKLPPRPAMPALDGNASAPELIQAMLQASRAGGGPGGLVLGENHRALAPKQFLVSNMPALKANGVDTLFLEHVCSDLHQQALDEYFAAPQGSPMPASLKAYQDQLTRGQMHMNPGDADTGPAYDYAGVVEAAKAAGIRVKAVDCEASYSINPAKASLVGDDQVAKQRFQVMNYLTARSIEEHEQQPNPGAWIAFVGSGHATTCEGVPGIAQLTGTLSLVVDESGKSGVPLLKTQVQNYAGELAVDAVFSMPPQR